MKILLALFFGVVVASVVAILMFGRQPGGVSFVVTFSDIQGLREGAEVTLEGEKIGEVDAVRPGSDEGDPWEVTLLIYPEHRRSVGNDSSARIVTSGLLSRTTEVRILNRSDAGAPIRPGSVVQGVEDGAGERQFLGRDTARRGVEQLREGWGNLSARLGQSMEEARDWFSSPEARNIQDRMERLRQDVQEFTVARAGEASDKMQDALARGRELVSELRDLGRDDLADEVSESLDTMTQQFEETMAGEQREQ